MAKRELGVTARLLIYIPTITFSHELSVLTERMRLWREECEWAVPQRWSEEIGHPG